MLPGGDVTDAVELAVEAENAGWDGFFAFEPTWGMDAWVVLAAAAVRTERIRLGTMVTPLPKRKPWEVASQAVTVDRLSGGRVILSVGLGAGDPRFWMFEDDPGRRVRAELMDEGLDLLALMYQGKPFEYQGQHFHAHRPDMMVPPPSVQQPRIPTWVVGLLGAPRSMRRSARWDGWLPNVRGDQPGPARPTYEQLAEGVAWLREERARHGLTMDGYDIVMEGNTEPGEKTDAEVGAWGEAGATWWLEANWTLSEKEVVESCRARLRAGPPRG